MNTEASRTRCARLLTTRRCGAAGSAAPAVAVILSVASGMTDPHAPLQRPRAERERERQREQGDRHRGRTLRLAALHLAEDVHRHGERAERDVPRDDDDRSEL